MSSAAPTFKGLLMLILHAAHQELGGRHWDGMLDFVNMFFTAFPLAKLFSQPNAVT